jgi:FkbM family methyltransferase
MKKMKIKKIYFYDKFAKFSREQFKDSLSKKNNQNMEVYNLGPFKICVDTVSNLFSLNMLEWNISYEFFDIVYPALNKNYFKFILGEGPYESKDVFIEKGDYVVDAGANLGIFSFLASMKAGIGGHIYAVEPIDFFINCIKKSLMVNSFENITLLNVSLGRENKETIIHLSSENPGQSGTFIKSEQGVKVRQVTLDSLVFMEKKVPRVNFLKMDIEGSERDALLGAREVILNFKPKLSICTYHLKDDPIVLRDIIKSVNPKYKIEMGKKKLYARI